MSALFFVTTLGSLCPLNCHIVLESLVRTSTHVQTHAHAPWHKSGVLISIALNLQIRLEEVDILSPLSACEIIIPSFI